MPKNPRQRRDKEPLRKLFVEAYLRLELDSFADLESATQHMSRFLDSSWYSHDGLMQPLAAAISYPYHRDDRYAARLERGTGISAKLERDLDEAVRQCGGYPMSINDLENIDWDCFSSRARRAVQKFRESIGAA